MKFLFLLFLILTTLQSTAQDTALYKQFPFIPSFKLLKVPDSTSFTQNDLPKKKPVLLIIFSPDCEHCQQETEELKKNIKLFKKTEILMVSAMPYPVIKKFYEDNGLKEFNNITVAFDRPYYLGTFYRVRTFPSIFLYDKKGNLKKEFDGSVPIQKIAEDL